MEAVLNRRPPSFWSLFWQCPNRTLAKLLHDYRQRLLRPVQPGNPPIKIVCISDTHNTYPDLPQGDLLIHAGDLSISGGLEEIQATLDWLAQQPQEHKVVIAGNHERFLDAAKYREFNRTETLDWHRMTYLQDTSATFRFRGGRTLTIYGSPWTREYGNWAFEYPGGTDHWSRKLPDDIDVLVTHMPPFAHLDMSGKGDDFLLQEVNRVRPRLHVFGHFHVSHGADKIRWDEFEEAFECLIREKSVVLNLLRMCWWYLRGTVSRRCVDMTMVNAAIVQGLRDDGRREAIVVDI